MSIGIKLVQAAQKEAALRRPFPHCVEAVETLPKGGTLRARAQIEDNDRLSKSASEVSVRFEKAKPGAAPDESALKRKAEKFAAGATYLTEELRFVETDVGGTAVVRSTPETMAGRGAPYFEAAITGEEITLRRFQAQADGKRANVPFCLTDDVLERLTEDAAGVLAPRKDKC